MNFFKVDGTPSKNIGLVHTKKLYTSFHAWHPFPPFWMIICPPYPVRSLSWQGALFYGPHHIHLFIIYVQVRGSGSVRLESSLLTRWLSEITDQLRLDNPCLQHVMLKWRFEVNMDPSTIRWYSMYGSRYIVVHGLAAYFARTTQCPKSSLNHISLQQYQSKSSSNPTNMKFTIFVIQGIETIFQATTRRGDIARLYSFSFRVHVSTYPTETSNSSIRHERKDMDLKIT